VSFCTLFSDWGVGVSWPGGAAVWCWRGQLGEGGRLCYALKTAIGCRYFLVRQGCSDPICYALKTAIGCSVFRHPAVL
jgi:hypothetical protein